MRKLSPLLLIGTPTSGLAIAALIHAPAWAAPWIVAGAVYMLFIAFYHNWRGPLTQGEINAFFDQTAASVLNDNVDAQGLRRFFEEDRGREFFMQNLIKLNKDKVKNPETGAMMPADQALGEYTGPFIRQILWRAGHPVTLLLRKGVDIDSWGATSRTGTDWPVSNIMRYRSRRDLMETIAKTEFVRIHPFKHAAIAESIAYPAHKIAGFFAGPRVTVALALALAASLANTAILALS